MDIFAGRPEATEGREAKEIKVYDLLDSLGIHYWRVDHEPISTMKEGLEIEETLNCLTCKNLFLCNRQQSRFYLLIMSGNKTLKSKELSQQIGSTRLNFAPENKMAVKRFSIATAPRRKDVLLSSKASKMFRTCSR